MAVENIVIAILLLLVFGVSLMMLRAEKTQGYSNGDKTELYSVIKHVCNNYLTKYQSMIVSLLEKNVEKTLR